MRIHVIRGGSRLWLGALAAVATVAIAAPALAASAAKPEKGKSYSGKVSRYETPISFTVSETGKSAGQFKIADAPFLFCQGGGVNRPKSHSARIGGNGFFEINLPLKSLNGKPAGHMTVTGRFAKGGKEAGKVTVDLKDLAPGSSCNGSSPYSTKAG